MGHDKLRKFAENETFDCLLQPSAQDLLRDGYAALADHPVKGHWGERFANPDAPLVLELGCGKGEYTIALAERNQDKNYLGVDIKGARLWKGAKYATGHALGNVGFLRTRIEFITAFFAPGEVSEIWLTFSDPQVRSENSRLTSPVFLDRYSKFLAPGGRIHLKTDSQFLYQYTLSVCRANALPVETCCEDLYAVAAAGASCAGTAAGESVGGLIVGAASGSAAAGIPLDPCLTEVQTFYETMFREQGYPIRYLCFRLDRDDAAAPAGGSQPEIPATKRFGRFVCPADFDPDYWRSIEGNRTLFGRDTAETRRQKLKDADSQR